MEESILMMGAAASRQEKNLALLNQLLRTMMGELAEHNTTVALCREMARHLGGMLTADRVLIYGWDPSTNNLILWADHYLELNTKRRSRKLHRLYKAGPFIGGSLASQAAIQRELAAKQPREFTQLLPNSKPGDWALLIPIRLSGKVLGLVAAIRSQKPRRFSESETIISQIFANHAAVILENVQLQEHSHRRATEIEGLRKASLELSSTLDVQEVVSLALRNVHRLLPDVRHASIYFCHGEELELVSSLDVEQLPFIDPRPAGWLNEVGASGESLYLGTTTGKRGGRETAILSMSLRVGDRTIGVIEIAYGPPRHLDDELRIARLLADQTATAIENARLHAASEHAAMTDVLTGLPNRRAFDGWLAEELRRAKRYVRFFSLAMIDLDHFKRINDRFGHRVGDVALQDIAHCLRARVRATDFLARVGGDEFVLILPETRAGPAQALCEKLRHSLQECLVGWTEKGGAGLSFSFGVAEYPRDGVDAATLMTLADQAMYMEKQRSTPGN